MLANIRLCWVLALALVGTVSAQSKSQDRIKELPGLTFDYTSAQYSGFLKVPSNNNLHYWFLESQRDPSNDPLVLWLNGGPGCSSLVGMFTELGPFYPNPDGTTVFENVYSWNKVANIIFLESPRNVGFSYGKNDTYNDVLTTQDSADALIEFLKRYPEYKGRDFYITGESYGGVYVPLLVEKVIDIILSDASKIPINFVGAAIGNGILSENQQTNSFVNLAFYRGLSDYDDTVFLRDKCCDLKTTAYEYCNFSQYVKFADNQTVVPVHTGDRDKDKCGDIVKRIVIDSLYNTKGYNKYSHEQSCYARTTQYVKSNALSSRKRSFLQVVSRQELAYSLSPQPIISDNIRHFIDQGDQRNIYSSDQLGGFPCFNNEIVETYLNDPKVRSAIHVDIAELKGRKWEECADYMDSNYIRQNRDTTKVFRNIKSKAAKANLNFRFLIYNGDADGVCNFLGDEWFVEALAKDQRIPTITERQEWFYTKDYKFFPAPAGFYKTFGDGNFQIDLVTVSGAGHYVPTFRPQQALQMFGNFLKKERDYTMRLEVNTTAKWLVGQYTPDVPDNFTRKDADRVFYLPGLSFEYESSNSNSDSPQYSGYLKGKDGHFLHYWLIESQENTRDADTPLIIWLNGGPGCSSLGGALTELGPFRPNPDGKTLSENIYSWNRRAHLLFLEAPRNVGFSYQNRSVDNDTSYSDEQTIEENYLALKDFFEVHDNFKKNNNPVFVMAESYGGVYGPTLTLKLIQEIKNGNLNGVNLVGMAIGNGELSAVEQIKSAGPLMYHRGLLGKNQYDAMLSCCGGDYNYLEFCDVTRFVYLTESGDAKPKTANDTCSILFADIVQKFWGYGLVLNAYNMYQDCYQQKQFVFGSRAMRRHKEKLRQTLLNDPNNQKFAHKSVNTVQNIFSTDNQGGFPCYGASAAANWLNTKDVRKALHIPDYVQNWTDCNDQINEDYVQQYNDTKDVFDAIVNSGHPMHILVYNGDVDLACNFIGDQWFIEGVAKRNSFDVTQSHTNWNIGDNIAGYVKKFNKGKTTIDLVTVKGAGHLVPTDRPLAALQMITNFVNNRNYNRTIDTVRAKKLLPQYAVEKQYSDAVGPISPVDLMAEQHPQLHASKKHKAAKETKKTPVPVKLHDPPTVLNADPTTDEITNLPGLGRTGRPPTKQYSGYLDISGGHHMHYWLVESQSADPTKDPLVLWLNGGPGCSSLGGLFKENGPFKPTKDGQTLVENIFSWNKVANVLYLESPRSVGFSWGDTNGDPNKPYNDDQTALDNFASLQQFFTSFPAYKNRELYITGESYGGVYVPKLVQLILSRKNQGGDTAPNFNIKGFAVGNGILNLKQQINSAVHLMYYRGAYDLATYQQLLSCCPRAPYKKHIPPTPCDFTKYLVFDKHGNSSPNLTQNRAWDTCANLINQWGSNMVWNTLNSVYNTYQDCYKGYAQLSNDEHVRRKRAFGFPTAPILTNDYTFIDGASMTNLDSTDALGGFPCYAKKAVETYLNKADVKANIHVKTDLNWQECNQQMNDNYEQQYYDTTPIFQSIYDTAQSLIDKGRIKKFKTLIYNGDADMACEFLGDEWFIYDFYSKSKGTVIPQEVRGPWYYMEPYNETAQYLPRISGFAKHFLVGSDISIDLVTVKGAGHFVPTDRPGPALQMIKNFITIDPQDNTVINYSLPLTPKDIQPTFPQASASDKPIPSRRDLDEVFGLPGLTFQPGFKQYSGYLQGEDHDNLLHYWLVEGQGTAATSGPLVLWLTGGPGCSSLGALLGENGPFFPNPDGQTLFENVFSWNKAANVLYLESPRGVGFSYQTSNNTVWNDDSAAVDVTHALADFLSVHSQYLNREFYISGESYGGVYIPTTAAKIIEQLDKTTPKNGIFNGMGLKFNGFLIGNGFISYKNDIKTTLDFYYFHGLIGKVMYDKVRTCCKKPNSDVCDLTDVIEDRGECQSYVDEAFDFYVQDRYNIYQQCYENTVAPFGGAAEKYHNKLKSNIEKSAAYMNKALRHRLKGDHAQSAVYIHQGKMNYASTDQNGGFYCYMTDAFEQYLNQWHVRDALHIPDKIPDFQFCRDLNYQMQYLDVTDKFKEIMNSNYVQSFTTANPFAILLHNGDNDLVCDFMEAEYFVENLKRTFGGTTAIERQPWRAILPSGNGGKPKDEAAVAGFRKQFNFKGGKVKFDLVTVKGSGHFVPTDRPLPAIQLFANFVSKKPIDNEIWFSLDRKDLIPRYKPLHTNPGTPHVPGTTPGTPGTGPTQPSGGTGSSQGTTTASSFVVVSTPNLFILFATLFIYRFLKQNL